MVYQWYINHLGFLFPVFKPTDLKCDITVSVHKEDDYQSFFYCCTKETNFPPV